MTAVAETPAAEKSADVQGRTLRQLAWARFKRNKVALGALTVAVVVVGSCLLSSLVMALTGTTTVSNADLISDNGGLPVSEATTGFFANSGTSLAHPLGVQPSTGKDILAMLLDGGRVTFTVALCSALLSISIGTVVGMVAAQSRGWVDAALGWLMDLVLSFPQLLILLALSSVIIGRLQDIGVPAGNPARILYMILVFSSFGWPYIARIVRGQVITLRESEFIEAAIAMGASPTRIIFRELLPNLWATLIVYGSITLPGFISSEATLAFLGVGVDATQPTWGTMLSDAQKFFWVDPTYLVYPAAMLIITVVSFNLLGDGVRDALDPRASRT